MCFASLTPGIGDSGCLVALIRLQIDETTQSRDNRGVVSLTRGPVAQLGARFHGMEEVIGSIPIRSTNLESNTFSFSLDTPTLQ